MNGANANGFDARDAQLTETVFSPNGTVHTVDLRSPGGILYGALQRRKRACPTRPSAAAVYAAA
jgi:hypothetical protein